MVMILYYHFPSYTVYLEYYYLVFIILMTTWPEYYLILHNHSQCRVYATIRWTIHTTMGSVHVMAVTALLRSLPMKTPALTW